MPSISFPPTFWNWPFQRHLNSVRISDSIMVAIPGIQYYPRTVYEGFSVRGWGLKSDNLWTSVVSESILSYAKVFGNHFDHATGGATYEKTDGQWKRVEAKAFRMTSWKMKIFLLRSRSCLPSQPLQFQPWCLSSEGSIMLSWDKYLLTLLTGEMEAANLVRPISGRDSLLQPLPGNCIKSHFWKKWPWIYELGLRLSYGQTGNQGIGAYASAGQTGGIQLSVQWLAANRSGWRCIAGPANDSLIWEPTAAWNFGSDLSVLGRQSKPACGCLLQTNQWFASIHNHSFFHRIWKTAPQFRINRK